MRQYSLAVKSAPLSTSACLLVPHWPHAKFNHLLKGLSILSEYPAGTHAKYPTKLYYSPPMVVSASASIIGGSARIQMSFHGKVAGYQAVIAADTQASHNFVSEQWVRRAGVHVTPITGTVTLATGKAAQIVGSCSVRLVIGPWHDVVDCFVMNMASHHDLILGDSYYGFNLAMLCLVTQPRISLYRKASGRQL